MSDDEAGKPGQAGPMPTGGPAPGPSGPLDPMVGARIAGRETLQRVLAALKDERGVQIEAVATALGALAGRACQLAATDGVQNRRPEYAGLTVMQVGSKDGQTYLMGPAINRPLAESQFSVWSLVAGYAQSKGAVLPDLGELFAHGTSTVGGPEFGRPRYAPGTAAPYLPVQYLAVWEPMLPHVVRFAPDPQQWPVVYGLAVQGLFESTGGQFDLAVLTRVVMDSAIATSKVVLAT
ncbi:hypothetical protein [Cellulomonas sp. URHD0024]|uniref:hypothetical protein n=1 Tax=Cellulomonas sp. URHD0024 TaxID=1302620 RepID=UPI000427D16F|nr:hypothetical protein [Cellulomonas sp. URHD0024]